MGCCWKKRARREVIAPVNRPSVTHGIVNNARRAVPQRQCELCKWLVKKVIYYDSRTKKKVVKFTCTNKNCQNYRL